MSARRTYRISGRVQGVGFRWWARQTASGLGLRGIVRNEPDGTVYLEATGTHDQLERFEQLLADGPPHAQVEELRREEEAGIGPLPAGFDITH